MLKKVILISGILSLVLVAGLNLRVELKPVERVNASNGDGCPDGSYNIGTKDGVNPICKLEPTGCPYGDSIPMEDCDKFKEQNEGKNESSSEVRNTKPTESKEEYSTCGTIGK